MKRPRFDVDPGTLARDGWAAIGFATQRVPLGPDSATLNGRVEGPEAWARLRWGEECTDGEPSYGCGLYLHVGQLHVDGGPGAWTGVARVRARLEVGRHVWAVDGDRREGAVIRSVRLARDARGAGGWAWMLDLVTVERWRRERRDARERAARLRAG